MNGAHDLGGMHGLGPVEIEQDEPVFHSQWEKRVFALTLASGFHGRWNLDMSRYAREQMPPAEYLATTYYEHWLFGLQKLLVDQELVTAQEMQTGHADAKKARCVLCERPKWSRCCANAARRGSTKTWRRFSE